jgi:hypothetical protein
MKLKQFLIIIYSGNVLLTTGCYSNKPVDKDGAISHARWYEKDSTNQIVTTPAPQWSNMLRQKSGWLGSDGMYSIPLNGVETASETANLFLFSDGAIGNIVHDTLQAGWRFVHNSVAYINGDSIDADHIHFCYRKDSAGNAISMFEPATPGSKPGDYYWMGDGLIDHALDSTLYIFAYHIRNIPGSYYPFEDVGLSLIAIPKNDKPPFVHQRQTDVPFFLTNSNGKGKVVFGISVLSNTTGSGALHPDGYIYIYGIRGIYKELLVARVKDYQFEQFNEWRFWDGSTWNENINNAAALTNRISNEMSVSFMPDGRVAAVYQQDADSPNIMLQAGEHPWGPFQPAKKIWETPEIYDGIDYYTYNAKAHPQLSKPGELLISYNVNSFQFEKDLQAHPNFYHPRFITVKL